MGENLQSNETRSRPQFVMYASSLKVLDLMLQFSNGKLRSLCDVSKRDFIRVVSAHLCKLLTGFLPAKPSSRSRGFQDRRKVIDLG